MKLFSIDGPIYRFMSRAFELLQLNFLWLLCCLPIVTFGASTIAAYTVIFQMLENKEGYIGKAFFKAFKANLKQGVPLGLLVLVVGGVIITNIRMFSLMENMPTVLIILAVFMAAYFLFATLYAFPLLARYNNSISQTLRNSVRISIRYFLRTFFLLALLALFIAMMLFDTLTLLFGLLLGPAFLFYLTSTFALKLFYTIEQRFPEAVEKPEEEEQE